MTAARKPISKKVRFEVFKRDGFTCQYCGAHPPDVILEVDHIIPVVGGGADTEENLVTSCFSCNRGKAANPLSVTPKSLAIKASEVQEAEDQLAGYRSVMQARADRIEDDAWRVADTLIPNSSKDGISRQWFQSIKIFNERLPLHEVIESADIARARKPYSEHQRFKYFCGVCWSKIKREDD